MTGVSSPGPDRLTGVAATAQPVFVAGGGEPVFGVLHEATSPVRRQAILMCAPFGWEEMCSRRSLRDWADLLASRGHTTLRIDLPGTGDSGGTPWDSGLLAAWTEAVARSAGWLVQAAGTEVVAAVGVGLGGMVVAEAASGGARFDELVLWGVPARGHTFIRELRAFSRLEASEQLEPPAEAAASWPEGALAVAGFVLSAETLGDLEQLELGQSEQPLGTARRALLLGRDGRPVDAALHQALERGGTQVTVGPGAGYAAMVGPTPQEARAPRQIFELVADWLGEGDPPEPAASPVPEAGELPTTAEMRHGGTSIRETALVIEHTFGAIFGVLAEPLSEPAGVCAVLLNSGAQRRVGPNRMWVEMARRWAASGVPTLRVDLAGIGDSGGDSEPLAADMAFYVPDYIDQTLTTLDALEDRGLAPHFVLGGLCSGAYWSLYAGLRDERVAAALMINPRILMWDGWVHALRQTREIRRKLGSREAWMRVVRREASFTRPLRIAAGLLKQMLLWPVRLPARMAAQRRAAREGGDAIDLAFDSLRDRGQRALMLFIGREPLYDDFVRAGRAARFGRWPNIELETVPLPEDTHTLRPVWVQRAVHDATDRAIQREIDLSR